MNLDWFTWSNPVSIWWLSLIAIAALNIIVWLAIYRLCRAQAFNSRPNGFYIELLPLLAAVYVFVCAFRSVFPRADVQRICLFDSWISAVFIGRTVATIAEVCFVVQWAIVLYYLARLAKSETARTISLTIAPLILIAECSSWYAVITTNYLGNAIENSLWAVTFMLIAGALMMLLSKFRGLVRLAIASAILGITAYAVFMFTIDVPMYLERWQADVASGRESLGLIAGLSDASTRWVVTHDIAQWQDEIAWMSLYFSFGVWASLMLGGFSLVKEELPRYRIDPAQKLGSGRLPARAGAG